MKNVSQTTARIALAALSGALLLSTPALAETNTRTYQYDRNVLATEEGAEALLKDIEREARKACTATNVKMTAREVLTIHSCVEDAVSGAVEQINSNTLDAALEARALRG